MPDIQFTLLAILLGTLASILIPYFRKLYEGKIEKFDWKYFWHLVVSTIWEFLLAITLYMDWQPPTGFVNDIIILILAFCFGFGGTDFQKTIEKVFSWLKDWWQKD